MPAENLLLLPGMMCDARLWGPQIDALELPISVADLSSADSIGEIAASVLANAPPRFAMAGLSMGGIVAFEIWRRAPERISHLALLDTNPHADTAEKQSLRVRQIEEVLEGKLRELAIESLKPVYLAEAHRDDESLLNLIMDMTMDMGPETFQRQSTALKNRCDSVPTLPTITCPTVVACGDEDALCPPSMHGFMAERIPGARFVEIPVCGHLSSIEQPEAVTQLLKDLLLQ